MAKIPKSCAPPRKPLRFRHAEFAGDELREQRVAQGGEGAGFVNTSNYPLHLRPNQSRERCGYLLRRQNNLVARHISPTCPRHFCPGRSRVRVLDELNAGDMAEYEPEPSRPFFSDNNNIG